MSQITNEQYLGQMTINNLAIWDRSIDRLYQITAGQADIKIVHGDLGNHNFNPFYQHVSKIEKAALDKFATLDWAHSHTDHDHGAEFLRATYGDARASTFQLSNEPQPSTLKVYWGSGYGYWDLWSKVNMVFDEIPLTLSIRTPIDNNPVAIFIKAIAIIEVWINQYLSWFRPLVKDIDYTLNGSEIKLKDWWMNVPKLKIDDLGRVTLSPFSNGYEVPDAYSTGLMVNYAYTKKII